MLRRNGCYQGRDNRAARQAILLKEVSQEARELCPRRNPDWRFQYFDGDIAYYSMGAYPNCSCELAGLIQRRLTIAFRHPSRLERTPEDPAPNHPRWRPN